jgi:Domain of unknown function (DUF4280)
MQPVCSGSKLTCSMGAGLSELIVNLPEDPAKTSRPWPANIHDSKPMANIGPFGVCRSMANPHVAAASAASRGALVPMPCVPTTAAPWAPGDPMTQVRKAPALSRESRVMCAWGGVIAVITPVTKT